MTDVIEGTYLPSLYGKGEYFRLYSLVQIVLWYLDAPRTGAEMLQIGGDAELEKRKINMWDIHELLGNCGVKCFGYQATEETIRNLSEPYLVCVRIEAEKHFVFVMPTLSDSSVRRVYDAANGWHEWNCEKLAKATLGAVVLLIRDVVKMRRSYEAAMARERHDCDWFWDNLRTIPNLLTANECENVIKASESLWEPSRTGGYSIEESSIGFRDSSTAMLPQSSHIHLSSLILRALGSAGSNITYKDLEGVQCIRYVAGQEFKPHYDILPLHDERSAFRTWTVIVYLADDFEGGQTYFPLCNKEITAQRGMALLFPNRYPSLELCPAALHTGRQIESGTKYILTTWFNVPITLSTGAEADVETSI